MPQNNPGPGGAPDSEVEALDAGELNKQQVSARLALEYSPDGLGSRTGSIVDHPGDGIPSTTGLGYEQ
jgi:hypothetical protein